MCGETSGVIANAFAKAGADVATCDIYPTTAPGVPQFVGDFGYLNNSGFGLVIGHPPCQYLSNAGARYLSSEGGRTERMREAAAVFNRMYASDAPFVALEHPVVHGQTTSQFHGLRPSQYVQPHQHGTGHVKKTALYLSGGLPELRPTNEVPGP